MNEKISLALGMICPGLWPGLRPEVTREPVAFLYNGVRLSDIESVWTDKETYPYAVILHYIKNDQYQLYLCSVRPHVTGAYINCFIYSTYNFNAAIDVVWNFSSSTSATSSFPLEHYSLIWANTDIFNSDGTVYLAASDPIPVYE